MQASLPSRLRALVLPAVATGLVASLLVGLGLWQLHRLAWKEDLLARIASRSTAPPSPLPPLAQWSSWTPADYEYRHFAVSGRFENAHEVQILRASADGPGYHVLTPFRLDSGGTILVDRGFVPAALQLPESRRAGELSGDLHLTGVLRAPEPRNPFTPTDEPARGQFFTRDPAAIARYLGLAEAAPFSLDLDAGAAVPGGWPRAAGAAVDIPNNHFSYALTWFGLALGLVSVFIAYAWSRLASSSPAGVAQAAPSP